jgi:hypothetical protein
MNGLNALAQIKKGIFSTSACLRNGTNKFIPKRIHSLLNSFSHHVRMIGDSGAKLRVLQPSIGPGEQQPFSGLLFPHSAIDGIADSYSSTVRFEYAEHGQFSSPFVILSLEKRIVRFLKGIVKLISRLIF